MSETEKTGAMASRSQLREYGKTLRDQVPRSSHSDWGPSADRPNPLDLLQAQDEGRLQRLLPIKYGRMLVSPFALLRGSAVVMAAENVELAGALIGIMGAEDLAFSMELAGVAGQLKVAGDVVGKSDMPIMAAFLAEKSELLSQLATDNIFQAAALRGVALALGETGLDLSDAGVEEMAEGATRLAVSRGMAVGSEVLAVAGAAEVAEGIAELAAADVLDEAAKDAAADGLAEVATGAAELGAADALHAAADIARLEDEE